MRIHRQTGRLSVPALIFAMAAVAVGFVTPTAALAQEAVYTVSGLKVDAKAETATQAREAAIAQGQANGFQTLVNRLVVREDVARLPRLSPAQVTPYVQDFSVADERSSAGRYIARFTFRFNPRSVRSLFQQAGVRFAETRSKPLVLLPLLAAAGTPQLWEEGNAWRDAWSRRGFEEGLVPLRVPIGDLSDVALISAAQAAAADNDSLIQIGSKYGGGGVLIAEAKLKGNADQGNASVSVAGKRFTNGRVTRTSPVTVNQQAGEDLGAMLERATLAVFEGEQTIWKQNNLLNFGSKQTILVRVPIARLDDWLQVRRRLENVSSVLTATPVMVKRSEAKLNLTYLGDEGQLVRALSQQDLTLRRARPPLVDSSGGSGLGQSPGYGQNSGLGQTTGSGQPPGVIVGGQTGGGQTGGTQSGRSRLFPSQPSGGFATWELGLAGSLPGTSQ